MTGADDATAMSTICGYFKRMKAASEPASEAPKVITGAAGAPILVRMWRMSTA
jgi:hypothetical protein